MKSTSSKPKNRLYSALLSGSLLALSLVPAVMAACSSSEEATPQSTDHARAGGVDGEQQRKQRRG